MGGMDGKERKFVFRWSVDARWFSVLVWAGQGSQSGRGTEKVSQLSLPVHTSADRLTFGLNSISLSSSQSPSLSVYLSPAHPCSLSFSITLSPSFLLPLSPDIEWHWEWLANSVKLHWSSSTHKNNEEWPVLIYSITNLLHSRTGLK